MSEEQPAMSHGYAKRYAMQALIAHGEELEARIGDSVKGMLSTMKEYRPPEKMTFEELTFWVDLMETVVRLRIGHKRPDQEEMQSCVIPLEIHDNKEKD